MRLAQSRMDSRDRAPFAEPEKGWNLASAQKL